MMLSPREQEKLLVFTAAEVARLNALVQQARATGLVRGS